MTISEVSKKYELSADTLRYYERIGLIPPVNRNKSGIRSFTEEDCEWVNFIKCMREMQKTLERLNFKIDRYEEGIIEKEKVLKSSRNKKMDAVSYE